MLQDPQSGNGCVVFDTRQRVARQSIRGRLLAFQMLRCIMLHMHEPSYFYCLERWVKTSD